MADTVLEVNADPEKGFSFPFILKIPESTETNYLIVETNNTGKVTDDFDQHYTSAKKAILGNAIGPWVSKKLKAPILIPVFPRSELNWETYTHALDRDTIIIATGELARLDLQLLAMINEAKNMLQSHSVEINEKVIMTGFSASGTFANRFSLLHPKALKLVVAGGLNGILMLPTSALNGKELNYPLGINDIDTITGTKFKLNEWKALPQFLFMGALDENDAAQFDDAYSDEERGVIYAAIGEKMQPDRWEKCQEVYKSTGAQAVFRTYADIGHGTNLKIHNDFLAFIKENI